MQYLIYNMQLFLTFLDCQLEPPEELQKYCCLDPTP